MLPNPRRIRGGSDEDRVSGDDQTLRALARAPAPRGVAAVPSGDPTLATGDATGGGGDGDPEIPRGATLGRYVVLGRIGAGGMGVVYAAYDPDLDRKVAVKLLRVRAEGEKAEAAHARLLREAQAMARLRHPNVVVVHDVGVYDGRVFLAMEFVEGITLTAWLERGHAWRERLAMICAAGRGLAAAHRAGLVHRDFKPDNVLVGEGSAAGTVVVTDFGLARAQDTAPPSSSSGRVSISTSGNAFDSPLTVTGALMGTPAYMAPEQLERGYAGAAADQFAFCVATFHALFGVRPFPGSSIVELSSAVLEGRMVDVPSGTGVPAWVRRAVVRGLALDPTQRFASMDELLDRLDVAARARRRGRMLALGIAGVAVAGGVAATALLHDRDPCPVADARIAELWGPSRREQLRAHFEATELPYAARSFEGVAARVDERIAAWSDARQRACRATRVEGVQSEAALDLRMACLDRRDRELAAALGELEHADAELIGRAIEFVGQATPVAVCEDEAWLQSSARLPDDPSERAQVQALVAELDGLATRVSAATIDEHTVPRLEAMLAESEALAHPATTAEIAYRLARAYAEDERYEDARAMHERALDAAATGGHDPIITYSSSDLVYLVGYHLARYDEAKTIARFAELALVRGGDRPADRATYETDLGAVLRKAGDHQGAIEHASRALEIRRELYGESSVMVASSLNNLGNAYNAAGEYAKGLELLERAYELRRAAYGDEHPRVAEALNNIGAALYQLGRYDEATAKLERSLAIRRKLFGPRHLLVASTLGNLGSGWMELERFADAEQALREALEITEQSLGAEHERSTMLMNNLANVLERQLRYDESIALHRRALAIREKLAGPHSLDAARSLTNLGVALENGGHAEEAHGVLARAVAIFGELDPRSPEAVVALERLGQLELGRENPVRAAELAEVAMEIAERTGMDPLRLAEAKFLSAQARWAQGHDRPGAVARAREALVILRGQPLRGDLLHTLEGWLASHRP